jgi:hypothetical protein
MDTISDQVTAYLDSVEMARSDNTARAYSQGLTRFKQVLKARGVDPDQRPITDLSKGAITWLAAGLKDLAPRFNAYT